MSEKAREAFTKFAAGCPYRREISTPAASYESRALSAYYRAMSKAERQGHTLLPPDASRTAMQELAGKTYVVLVDDSRVLAVYRVTPKGQIRRLRRWPKALDPDEMALWQRLIS